MFHGERPIQNAEGAYLFDLGKKGIDFTVNALLHGRHHLRVLVQILAGEVVFGREFFGRFRFKANQRRNKAPIVANDHRIPDQRQILQRRFDILGGDILAARGDDDFLLAADNGQIPFAIKLPQVAREEPAISREGFGRGFGVAVIPHKYIVPLDLNLAIFGQAHLHPRPCLPDRAVFSGAGAVHRRGATIFRLAIHFIDGQIQAAEKLQNLLGDRCGTAHPVADAVYA